MPTDACTSNNQHDEHDTLIMTQTNFTQRHT